MDLSLSIASIKGVGEKTAQLFYQNGIFTIRDLLYYFPRDYENYQTASSISALRPGKVLVKGKFELRKTTPSKKRHLTITEGLISDQTGAIRVVWFNQPYRAKQFDKNKEYFFSGDYEFRYGRFQLTSPSAVLATDVMDQNSHFSPIYPAKKNLTPKLLKKIMNQLQPVLADIEDIFPSFYKQELTEFKNLPLSRGEAFLHIHFPNSKSDYNQARLYFTLEEMFVFILAAKLNKTATKKLNSFPIPLQLAKTKSIINSLPFKLTNSQKIATWEIIKDLNHSAPTNRLLQGDVGSGKTIVAALVSIQAVLSDFQVAVLAPTAILASQHAKSFDQILSPLGIKTALLVGATKQKELLKRNLANGEIDLLVGTHAILTDDTKFKKLGLVIIDEQHRLGVAQRQKLLTKSNNYLPHLLSMTATPIPRSLQLTLFGDLDISTLKELPSHKKPIVTRVLTTLQQKDLLYPAISQALKNQEQIYWVVRAIEDKNPSQSSTATKSTTTLNVVTQTKLLQKLFPTAKVSSLHGQLKVNQKEQIMQDFLDHKIDILVSTTVIEVGINVPNATIIAISEAEKYGLAQLHQLRGRVGRGEKPGACFLVTSSDTPVYSRRLKALEKSNDGFYLSEVDLKTRGPGEIYGNLQHGALDLRIADLSDFKTNSAASRLAEKTLKLILDSPHFLDSHPELKLALNKYQQLTTLN